MVILTSVCLAEAPPKIEKGQISKDIGGYGGNAWWDDQTAAWFGGIGGGIVGSVIGLMGAAIGILAGAGIARKVCLALMGVMFVFGLAGLALALLGGLAALVFSQPYAVYYPLLLIGTILGLVCTILPAIGFRSIKQRYEQKELQKMHAMDVK
jgi:hypothetical protein